MWRGIHVCGSSYLRHDNMKPSQSLSLNDEVTGRQICLQKDTPDLLSMLIKTNNDNCFVCCVVNQSHKKIKLTQHTCSVEIISFVWTCSQGNAALDLELTGLRKACKEACQTESELDIERDRLSSQVRAGQKNINTFIGADGQVLCKCAHFLCSSQKHADKSLQGKIFLILAWVKSNPKACILGFLLHMGIIRCANNSSTWFKQASFVSWCFSWETRELANKSVPWWASSQYFSHFVYLQSQMYHQSTESSRLLVGLLEQTEQVRVNAIHDNWSGRGVSPSSSGCHEINDQPVWNCW